MTIELKNIGKKFNKDWLFQHLNYTFNIGESHAITGFNGSGKSTLLQIIAGFIIPSEGEIVNKEEENTDNAFKNISIAAPYLELIEEMTATEFLHFHLQFKTYINNISIQEILNIVQLTNAANKQIRYFSSGMKQRLKLAQAFFSDTNVLLLDEPCSNLDKQGISLYQLLIKNYTTNRLVIICSNDDAEYSFCNKKISLS
jgi:ABC-type multidrug transport system ATPase subunit